MVHERDRPDWSVEGRDWPNRASSVFVQAGGLDWHVQRMGEGPRLLLVHGTGAASHSFRDLAPLLAERFEVIVPDLPGHGFTQRPRAEGLSLPGMCALMRLLLLKLDVAPDIVVGHSAGAAILVQMVLDGAIRPHVIVSINGALTPIRGAALFSPLAKALFLNPLAPRLFAWRASGNEATRRLLEGTGSTLDARGIGLYARLFRKPGHVSGTLGMMANWNLDRLTAAMPELAVPLVLVSAAADRAVPPSVADEVAARIATARRIALPHGGHLVHEEDPQGVARLIVAAWDDVCPGDGLSPGGATSGRRDCLGAASC
jgi:magnesium chelatase accessory protein